MLKFTQNNQMNQYLSDELDNDIDIENPVYEDFNDTENVEIYEDPYKLIYDAIQNIEIISFNYTSKKGKFSTRTIEPHYTHIAMTGNELVIGFDLDIQDIRAFIIGNIHINGVRYIDMKFSPKSEIMQGYST